MEETQKAGSDLAAGPRLDAERQQRAREYAAIRRRLFLADLALGGILAVALLATGATFALRDAAASLSPLRPLALAIYLAPIGLGYTILGFPLTVYAGYYLPRRYGLSVQRFPSWLADLAKSLVLSALFALVILEIMYAWLEIVPAYWWLLTAAVIILFGVVLANLSPILIMPLFNRFEPLRDQDLSERLRRLLEQAGTRVRGVFTMDTSRRATTANAMLTGLGQTRRIILTDTLVRDYSPEEIEVILAHELGHHVHGDIWRGILAQAGVVLITLLAADLALRAGARWLGFGGIGDIAAFPLFLLVTGAAGVLAMPAGNAFSRAMESAADRYALRQSRLPGAFISAMEKLADQNLSEANPPRWVKLMFYSHPPVSERVAMARQFARRSSRARGGIFH